MSKKKCNDDCFNCPYDDCVKPQVDSAYYREYYKNNKEKILEQRKKYREKNREKVREYQREWYRRKNASKGKKQTNTV